LVRDHISVDGHCCIDLGAPSARVSSLQDSSLVKSSGEEAVPGVSLMGPAAHHRTQVI
jgi:hypothetical protein